MSALQLYGAGQLRIRITTENYIIYIYRYNVQFLAIKSQRGWNWSKAYDDCMVNRNRNALVFWARWVKWNVIIPRRENNVMRKDNRFWAWTLFQVLCNPFHVNSKHDVFTPFGSSIGSENRVIWVLWNMGNARKQGTIAVKFLSIQNMNTIIAVMFLSISRFGDLFVDNFSYIKKNRCARCVVHMFRILLRSASPGSEHWCDIITLFHGL